MLYLSIPEPASDESRLILRPLWYVFESFVYSSSPVLLVTAGVEAKTGPVVSWYNWK